jgi:hypothetical protein
VPEFSLEVKEAKQKRKKRKQNSKKSVCFAISSKEAKKVF